MIGSLTSLWNRVFAVLGRVSMYRLVYLCLAALAVIALLVSFTGTIAPTALELVVTLVVLVGRLLRDGCRGAADHRTPVAHRVVAHHRAHPALRPASDARRSRRSRGSRSPGSWPPSRSTCWRGGGATSSTRRPWARRCSRCSASGGRSSARRPGGSGRRCSRPRRDPRAARAAAHGEGADRRGLPRDRGHRVGAPRVGAVPGRRNRLPGLGGLLADPVVLAVPLPRRVHAVRAAHDAAAALAAADHRGGRRRARGLADPDRRRSPSARSARSSSATPSRSSSPSRCARR